MTVKGFSSAQATGFDTEHVSPTLWRTLIQHIDATFPHGRFRFLDVGGGSGSFSDHLLERYPAAHATVLDDSRRLLARNRPHARKFLVEESADSIGLLDGGYDLVCFNWVLHHLVGAHYRESVDNIERTLRDATGLLSDRGRISIFEKIYDGLLVGNAPSHIIFRLTSARSIAPLVHGLGTGSSHGVCFQSKASWDRLLQDAGITTLAYEEDARQPVPWSWRAFLHVRDLRCGLFWTTSEVRSLPRHRLTVTLDALDRR